MRTNTRRAAPRRGLRGRGVLGPISESELDEAMLLVLREANVRLEIVYAYQKTARLVEENAKPFSERELAEMGWRRR